MVSALVIAGALLVWSFYWVGVFSGSPPKVGGVRGGMKESATVIHPATVMQPDLYPTLNKVDEIPAATEKVYGGIVSHHFYMEEDIGKLFLQLRQQNPSVVVIVGPNHFNAGNADIQTSSASYTTPFGQLDGDLPLISRLVADGAATHEEFAFEREHSIGALVGFTKKVFPNAKLLPIIIRRSTSPGRTEQLAAELEKILPQDALVLASVDFSHHLDRFAAGFHDSQSVAALLSVDFNRIRSLEVDSPQSLEVLMRYLESRGALHMEYKNTNQAVYGGNLMSDDVTSYVFAKFTSSSSPPPQEGSPSSSSPNIGPATPERKRGEEARRGIISNIVPPLTPPILGGGKDTATLLHLGIFNAGMLESNEGKALYALGGPENNFLRGGDLKVIGTNNKTSCNSARIPALERYKINVFNSQSCANTFVFGSENRNYNVGFISIAQGENVSKAVAIQKKNYAYVAVQVPASAEAQSAIDYGADAVFIQDGAAKVELYKNKPIIHHPASNTSGFSTGVVFNPAGASNIAEASSDSSPKIGEARWGIKLYTFPYQLKNNQLTRLDISARLKSCKQILTGLKNVDGCSASIQ